MVENKKKPEIRFKDFMEDWDECMLGEVGETYTGLSGKTKNDFGKGNGKYVTYMNVFSNPISNLDLTEQIEIDKRQNEVQAGDVFFTTSSETPDEVGMSSVWLGNSGNVYLNSFCFGYRLIEKFDIYYLAYMLRSPIIRKKISFLAQGISRYNISKNKVMEIAIPKPSLNEQSQIGAFFKSLEALIILHQHKYNKLANVKKAMIEKMFPKDGADVPEIRFKGFVGAWEERKLGDLSLIGDIDHRMPESVTDGIPYLMTGDFVGINELNFENAKLISIKDYEQLSKKIKPEAGDILFARYASVGAVRYVETQIRFLISYSCAILKQNAAVNGEYLFYYLQASEIQRQIEIEINTGSQRNIGIDSLKKFTILLPHEKEQEKIATFFKQLNNNLILQQRELEKLNNIKKSLLEKMFV